MYDRGQAARHHDIQHFPQAGVAPDAVIEPEQHKNNESDDRIDKDHFLQRRDVTFRVFFRDPAADEAVPVHLITDEERGKRTQIDTSGVPQHEQHPVQHG